VKFMGQGKKMQNPVIIMLILFSSFSGSMALAQVGSPTDIKLEYSAGVTADQKQEIQRDLSLLNQVPWVDPSGELRHLLSGSSLKFPWNSSKEITKDLPTLLKDFLSVRMHYILDVEHPIAGLTVNRESINRRRFLSYDDLELESFDHLFQPPTFSNRMTAVEGQGNTVMSNIGTLLYISGKDTANRVTLNVSGVGKVRIDSPRVGIFKIGRTFFSSIYDEHEGASDFLHQAFRLTTMFHESRHEDGNASSLGFLHIVCPEGHAYQGLVACDLPSNGPYRLGALILESIKNSCHDCSPGLKDALEILRNDNLYRIQSFVPGIQLLLTKNQKEICELDPFNTLGLKGCGGNLHSFSDGVIEWDDKPEGIK